MDIFELNEGRYIIDLYNKDNDHSYGNIYINEYGITSDHIDCNKKSCSNNGLMGLALGYGYKEIRGTLGFDDNHIPYFNLEVDNYFYDDDYHLEKQYSPDGKSYYEYKVYNKRSTIHLNMNYVESSDDGYLFKGQDENGEDFYLIIKQKCNY